MECLGMLHESQEEIKELRSKSGPSAHLCFSQSYGVFTGVRHNGRRHVPKGRRKSVDLLAGVWCVSWLGQAGHALPLFPDPVQSHNLICISTSSLALLFPQLTF